MIWRLSPVAAAAALLLPCAAQAVPTVFNADLVQGVAAFDAAVQASGSALATQTLRFLADNTAVFTLPGLTISATDGRNRLVEDDYAALREHSLPGAMSGWAIGISPYGPVAGSGLTFTFDQPVNAFGLEVGDWATCCYASALYIAFDGGATRLVASAASVDDNPGWAAYRQATSFVGAVDTSGTFTRVTFYGDGVGEFMVAGGTLRWAALPLTQPPAVGEPPAWALALAGAAALAVRRRRA